MIRINGTPVVQLALHMPLNGAWSAEIHAAAVAPFAINSVATLALPGQTLTGRVSRCELYSERVHVSLVGGTQDWQTPVTGTNYTKVLASKVLTDLSVSLSDETQLTETLAFWTRIEGTIGLTIQLLARHFGLNWRVNPDGRVRIAAENPQAVQTDSIEVYRDESKGNVELAIENATVLPGVLVGSDVVGDVIYKLGSEGRLTCWYWTEGRGRQLEKYIRWVTRDTMYLGQYDAKVAKASTNDLLDLIPEDPRLRGTGLQGVPLLHGFPGCNVHVPANERVLLGFRNGDPTKPFASLWHTGNVTVVNIGGSIKVALSTLVDQAFTTRDTDFTAHVHTSAAPGSPTTPPVAPLVPLQSVAAQKLGTE